jgi:hypothetical protein
MYVVVLVINQPRNSKSRKIEGSPGIPDPERFRAAPEFRIQKD